MTEQPEEQVAVPQPDPEPKKEEKEPKQKADKESGFPVGQAAVGGVGAITLGSYALASVVGPMGWLAAPAAATAAGAGYVAYKRRKKRGGRQRSEKVTTTKTSGSRSSGGGLLGGSRASAPVGARGSSTATRSGGVGAAGSPRQGGGSTSGGGSSARPGGSPRSGGAGPGSRGAAPRSAGGSTTPRSGSSGGRTGGGAGGSGRPSPSRPTGGLGSPDSTSKRKTSPNGGTGDKPGAPRTPGGRMKENRWGGASGPTSGSGRKSGWGSRARDWADDKTGRKASSAWRGARGHKGFHTRRRAAGQAVKDAGGGGFLAGLLGIFAALFAGIASLFGWGSSDKPKSGTGQGSSEQPNKESDPDEPAATSSGPDEKPKPTNTTDTPDKPEAKPTGGNTMSGLPAAALATDMAAAMARYTPEDAWAVVAESRQWPDMSAQVAMSVKAYVDRLEAERFPLNDAVVEKLREFAQAVAATRSIAEEIHPLIRQAHKEDLDKKEAPRGNEQHWNV